MRQSVCVQTLFHSWEPSALIKPASPQSSKVWLGFLGHPGSRGVKSCWGQNLQLRFYKILYRGLALGHSEFLLGLLGLDLRFTIN